VTRGRIRFVITAAAAATAASVPSRRSIKSARDAHGLAADRGRARVAPPRSIGDPANIKINPLPGGGE